MIGDGRAVLRVDGAGEHYIERDGMALLCPVLGWPPREYQFAKHCGRGPMMTVEDGTQ